MVGAMEYGEIEGCNDDSGVESAREGKGVAGSGGLYWICDANYSVQEWQISSRQDREIGRYE